MAKRKPSPLQLKIMEFLAKDQSRGLPIWRPTAIPSPGEQWAHELINILPAGWTPLVHFRFLTHCGEKVPKGYKVWGNVPLAKLIERTQAILGKAFGVYYDRKKVGEAPFQLKDPDMVQGLVRMEKHVMAKAKDTTDDKIDVTTSKRRGGSKKKVAKKAAGNGGGFKKKAARKKAPAGPAARKKKAASNGAGSKKKVASKKRASSSNGGATGVIGPMSSFDWDAFEPWLSKKVRPNENSDDAPREGSLLEKALNCVPKGKRGIKMDKLVEAAEETGMSNVQARRMAYHLVNRKLVVAA